MSTRGSAPQLQTFFDPFTFTLTYVLWDAVTRDAVVIDPVIDYDPITQMISGRQLSRLISFLRAEELTVHWVLDTHAHADHLSASHDLREMGLALSWGMSARMGEVFENFKRVFAWPSDLKLSSLGVDRWFGDGEEFAAGALRVQAIATPGHTPACVTYRVGEWLFTGDALFMPDSGVGRCDFPGGSASQLYDSIWGKLYALPDSMVTFTGHDYQPGGRLLRSRALLGEQKASNIHLRESTSRADFVRFRETRDKTLSAPRLLHPSLDWNLGAYQLVKRPKSVFSLANGPSV